LNIGAERDEREKTATDADKYDTASVAGSDFPGQSGN
jgi:hypothetical protein